MSYTQGPENRTYVTGLAYLKHCPEASEASNTLPHAYTRLVLGVFTYFAGLLPQLGLACVTRAGSMASYYMVLISPPHPTLSYLQLVGFSVST